MPLILGPRLSRSSSRNCGKGRLGSQTLKSIPFSSHLHEVEQRTDLDRQPMALFEKSDDLGVGSGRPSSSQVGNLCLEGGEF